MQQLYKPWRPLALAGLLVLSAQFAATAQRGLPPKKKTRSTLVTRYAQHLDFLPDMVKLLKVPEGWEVKVAASGLR